MTVRLFVIAILSTLALTSAQVLNKVLAGVSDAEFISRSDLAKVVPGKSNFQLSASALNSDKLQIEFDIDKSVHQSFVRLGLVGSKHDVVFLAQKSESDSGDDHVSYKSVISFNDEVEKFAHRSGVYSVSLIIADPSMSTPINVVIGTVDVKVPAKPAASHPLYAKSLLHASDVTLEPLPEIVHVNRPPAVKASNFMATVFSALTGLPLVVFVLYALSLRFSLALSLSALVGVASLALSLGLYVSYWLALEGVSFYQTIKYGFALLPITAVLLRWALGVSSAGAAAAAADKSK